MKNQGAALDPPGAEGPLDPRHLETCHTLRERFTALRREHPLPLATGEAADKALFDDLSGEL